MSTTAEKPVKTSAERAEEHAAKVASLLIEQLRKGTAPWQRPWELSTQSDVPTNATTGKPYRGSNYIYLWATQIEHGWSDDNRWLTYRQAESIGAQVKKGEHGTSICFAAQAYEAIKRDESGKPVIGADGQAEKIFIKYDQPRMKYYTVFHAAQCDGMPPLERKTPLPEWERHQRAEAILEASGAVIKHGGNRAYYMPSLDYIQLPARGQFASPDRYYATALHELGHWTGHTDRLNRDGITGGHAFGSEGYAKEELRAEISSLMVGQELGIGHDPEQHVAYVANWIAILQDDPKEILHAASDASKIQEYVLQYDLEREQSHEQHAHPEAEPLPLARVTDWETGALDAACIANLDTGGKAIETWGDERPGLAVRDIKTQDRIWLRYHSRSPEWSAVTNAMRGIEPYEARIDALVRTGTSLDKTMSVNVQITKNLLENPVVSLSPVGMPQKAVVIHLEKDDAHRFANAMDISNGSDRQAYAEKLESLRVENSKEREPAMAMGMPVVKPGWYFDGSNGAAALHVVAGRTIETSGDRNPVLEISDSETQNRITVTLDERSAAWQRLATAIERGEKYEGILPSAIGNDIKIIVGRTVTGRVALSLSPLGRENETMVVRLDHEDTHHLAKAMRETTNQARRGVVYDALREHVTELENAHER